MQKHKSLHSHGPEIELTQGVKKYIIFEALQKWKISEFQARFAHRFFGFWPLSLRCRAISNGWWLVEQVSKTFRSKSNTGVRSIWFFGSLYLGDDFRVFFFDESCLFLYDLDENWHTARKIYVDSCILCFISIDSFWPELSLWQAHRKMRHFWGAYKVKDFGHRGRFSSSIFRFWGSVAALPRNFKWLTPQVPAPASFLKLLAARRITILYIYI